MEPGAKGDDTAMEQAAPQGYPPAQQGNPPAAGQQPQYPVQQQQPVTQVVVTGGCPKCQGGVLTDSYTTCGIVLAICFFPLGIICCLMMKEKRCTGCNARF